MRIHLTKESLEYLAKGLREGEGPDRRLDLSIDLAFVQDDDQDKILNETPERARHYTSLIDSALGLGRRTPGLNMIQTHADVVAALPPSAVGAAFPTMFSRAFCLAVIEYMKIHHAMPLTSPAKA